MVRACSHFESDRMTLIEMDPLQMGTKMGDYPKQHSPIRTTATHWRKPLPIGCCTRMNSALLRA